MQTNSYYEPCEQSTIGEAFEAFLSQLWCSRAWIKTPTLWVYIRKTRKQLNGELKQAVEISNFSYYFKADEIIVAINTIHALNPTYLTHVEGEELELSPPSPSVVLEEVFPLGAWLESNGWERELKETSSHSYYKLTNCASQHYSLVPLNQRH
ncbi:hypothetical protein [Chroococcidiopsis sp. CCMEE 29]|uniref:hypothetical protein n=1 Tax=Chroococcidiopsis sp. CCMEE 29 TaxID=155894 RepID=UPI00202222EC|nr:hypothetical protein [Chroococcidiopsis sp. CCMEE 29]